jgi:hypothetical protein
MDHTAEYVRGAICVSPDGVSNFNIRGLQGR